MTWVPGMKELFSFTGLELYVCVRMCVYIFVSDWIFLFISEIFKGKVYGVIEAMDALPRVNLSFTRFRCFVRHRFTFLNNIAFKNDRKREMSVMIFISIFLQRHHLPHPPFMINYGTLMYMLRYAKCVCILYTYADW